MKNSHIIIKSSLTYVILLYSQKSYPFIQPFVFSREWSLKCYWIMIFKFFFVQMILNFQKEINVIMYIIEKKLN
jgi:hypothetical protein